MTNRLGDLIMQSINEGNDAEFGINLGIQQFILKKFIAIIAAAGDEKVAEMGLNE